MNIQHFLITRFNVRIPWEPFQNPDDAWLKSRWELFDKICLPSVRRQESQHFRWLVLLDAAQTPDWLTKSMAEKSDQFPLLCPRGMEVFTPDRLARLVQSELVRGAETIITTRLDSDDCIAPGYMQRVQHVANCAPGFRGAINFDEGYVYEKGECYSYSSQSNAFFSFVDSANSTFKTCHHFNHNKINEECDVKHVVTGRWWLILNHEGNISIALEKHKQRPAGWGRKMGGTRVRTRYVSEVFGASALDSRESPSEFWCDNVFLLAREMRRRLRQLIARRRGHEDRLESSSRELGR